MYEPILPSVHQSVKGIQGTVPDDGRKIHLPILIECPIFILVGNIKYFCCIKSGLLLLVCILHLIPRKAADIS